MIPLYSNQEFDTAKSGDKLPCQCKQCCNTFYKSKRDILKVMRNKYGCSGQYCSAQCSSNSRKNRAIVICETCGVECTKHQKEINRFNHHFCSSSCAAIYHHAHKTTGYRRSKLEKYLEEQLSIKYPSLQIDYNKTSAINSELDIYIPSLHLAFELNGIFHYEPIYGSDKLNKIQNNDQRKIQACIECNIDFCLIDVSHMSYFKEQSANKYLEIILNIIDTKLDMRAV